MLNRDQLVAEGGCAYPGDTAEIFASSNTLRHDGALIAVHAGAYVGFQFTGNVLRLGFETEHLRGSPPVLAITIDGRQSLHHITTVLTFILPHDGLHNATVLFESRGDYRANAWHGMPWPEQAVVLHTIVLSAAGRLGMLALRPYRIEIDGDSITEGIGTVSPDAGSAMHGFALNVAGLLRAEVGIHGWSGNGYAAPGGGIPWHSVARWRWHAQPRQYGRDLDMLMVFEGNNDGLASADQLGDCVRLGLQHVLTAAPSHMPVVVFGPLLSTTCAAGHGGMDVPALESAIEAAVLSLRSDRLHFFRIAHLYDAASTLDGIHPDARLSTKVIAPAIAAMVAPILERRRQDRGGS